MKVRTLIVLPLALAALAVTAGPAGATPTDAAAAGNAALAQQVSAALSANPTAKQTAPNQIRWPNGAELTFPLPGEKVARSATESAAPQGSPNCPQYHVCLYWDINYNGARIAFYYCGEEDLATYYVDPYTTWRNRASSWDNNQSSGTYSGLYDGGDRFLYSAARATRSNFNFAPGPDKNDTADWILVC